MTPNRRGYLVVAVYSSSRTIEGHMSTFGRKTESSLADSRRRTERGRICFSSISLPFLSRPMSPVKDNQAEHITLPMETN